MNAAQPLSSSQSLMVLSLPFASTYLANCALNITSTKAALSSTLGFVVGGAIAYPTYAYAKGFIPLSQSSVFILRAGLSFGALCGAFLASKLAGKRYDPEFSVKKVAKIYALAMPITLVAASAIGQFTFSHFVKEEICPNAAHISKEHLFGYCD